MIKTIEAAVCHFRLNQQFRLCKLLFEPSFLRKVCSDIVQIVQISCAIFGNEENSDNLAKFQRSCTEILLSLTNEVHLAEDVKINQRDANPGSWYDILEYHNINFYPSGELLQKVTGLKTLPTPSNPSNPTPPPKPSTAQIQTILCFIQKYLQSLPSHFCLKSSPTHQDLVPVFRMHLEVVG